MKNDTLNNFLNFNKTSKNQLGNRSFSVKINYAIPIIVASWLLASCGNLQPVVFQDGGGTTQVVRSLNNVPLTELPTDRPSGAVASSGTFMQNNQQSSATANTANIPISVVDTIPGTFIPEGGDPGFDLFNVENPIELTSQNNDNYGSGGYAVESMPPQQAPQTVLSDQSYGGFGSTGLNFVPDASKREVVVRSYNHTPGSVGLNVGDTFTFSNPTTSYTVRSITVDSIFWDADNSEQSVTTHNLLMPAASWSSEGRGQGSREIDQVQGGLFPLAVGNTMSFKAVTNANISPYRWESFWSCSVINRGFVTVVAGEFDTYVITCSRSSLDEVTFYFAPKLGHYVRQEVKAPGNPEVYVRELIAYDRPSLSYSAGLPSRVDNTLMTGISPGSQARFRSTHLPGEVSVDSQMEDAIKAQRQITNANSFLRKQPTTTQTTILSNARNNSRTGVARVSDREAPSGIYVHLASYRQQKNVDLGVDILKKDVPELRALSFTNLLVSVPSKGGEFFRLFVGPFSSASDAIAICNAVKQSGSYCQVTQTP